MKLRTVAYGVDDSIANYPVSILDVMMCYCCSGPLHFEGSGWPHLEDQADQDVD